MTRYVAALVIRSLCAVFLLAAGCSDGEQQPTGTDERLALLEKQLADMEQRHAEERDLMVRALDASSSRLDHVLTRLTGDKPAGSQPTTAPDPAPDPKTDAKTDPETEAAESPKSRIAAEPEDAAKSAQDATAAETDNGGGFFESVDFVQVMVIFLAVALLVLVVLVVFFPGPLRGSVPQMQYSAIEEEAIAGLEPDPEPTLLRTSPPEKVEIEAIDLPDLLVPRPVAGPTITARLAASSRYDDVGDTGDPVAHELTLPLDDPAAVADLAQVLDSYLSTEPYILNEPAPQVAVDESELHLRFFALPTLSSTEHELLDASVRRLQPHRPGPRRTAG